MAGDEQYSKVGPYILMETLGVGSFGKVKLALHSTTHQRFACKILNKHLVRERVLSQQVQKEIDIMQRLRHRNTVSLVSVLSTSTKVFIVMELVTGGELYDEILRHKRLSEPYARFYFRQLIDGLQHCHDHGVYHRDLKPENLLLDENNTLKITDFGLSALKASVSSGSESVTGSLTLHTQCGTPNYVAPEIINLDARGYSGAKVDAWSCGIILYVLVAGALPFDDNEMDVLFKRILRCDLLYPPYFSDALVDLISNLLKTEPLERYSLADVKQHPWFNDDDVHTSIYLDEPEPAPSTAAEPAYAASANPHHAASNNHLAHAPAVDPQVSLPPAVAAPPARTLTPPSSLSQLPPPSASTAAVPDVMIPPAAVRHIAPNASSVATSPRSVSPDADTHDTATVVSGQASLLMKYAITNQGGDATAAVPPITRKTDSLDFGTRVESVESQLATITQMPPGRPTTPVRGSSDATRRSYVVGDGQMDDGNIDVPGVSTELGTATSQMRLSNVPSGELVGPLSRFRSQVLGGSSESVIPSSDDDIDSELEEVQELPQSLFVGSKNRVQNLFCSSSSGNPTERRAYSMNDIEGEELPETSGVQREASIGDATKEGISRMRRRVKRQLWDRAAELWRTPAPSYRIVNKNLGLSAEKELSPLHLSRTASPSANSSRDVEVIGVRKSQSVMEPVSLGTAMFVADALPSKRKSMLGVSPASRRPKLVRSNSHDGSMSAVPVRRRPRAESSQNFGTAHDQGELPSQSAMQGHPTGKSIQARSRKRLATHPKPPAGHVRRPVASKVKTPDAARSASGRPPAFRPDKDWVHSDADKMVWCKMMKDYDMVPDENEFEMDSSVLNDLWTAGLSRENLGRKDSFAASRFTPQIPATRPPSQRPAHAQEGGRSIPERWQDLDPQLNHFSPPKQSRRQGRASSASNGQQSKRSPSREAMVSPNSSWEGSFGSVGEYRRTTRTATGGAAKVRVGPQKSSVASTTAKKPKNRKVTIASEEVLPASTNRAMDGHRYHGVHAAASGADRSAPAENGDLAEGQKVPSSAGRDSYATLSSMPSHMLRELSCPRSSPDRGTLPRLSSTSRDDASEGDSRTESVADSLGSFGSSASKSKERVTRLQGRSGSSLLRLGEEDVLSSAERMLDAEIEGLKVGSTSAGARSNLRHNAEEANSETDTGLITQLAAANVDIHNALLPGKHVDRRAEIRSNGSDFGTVPSVGSTLDGGAEDTDRNDTVQTALPRLAVPLSNSASVSQTMDNTVPVSPFLLDIPGPRGKHIPASNPLLASLLPSVSSAKALFRKPSSPLLVKSSTHFHSLLDTQHCSSVLQELLRAYGCSRVRCSSSRSGTKCKIDCDLKREGLSVTAVITVHKLDDGLSAVYFKRKGKTDSRQFLQFYNDVYKKYCEKSKAVDTVPVSPSESRGQSSGRSGQANDRSGSETGEATLKSPSVQSEQGSFLKSESSGSGATSSTGFRPP